MTTSPVMESLTRLTSNVTLHSVKSIDSGEYMCTVTTSISVLIGKLHPLIKHQYMSSLYA